MTPMVDIAFLLLIFYMVSTVFAMPQAMEINLPPKDEMDIDVEVKESNLLTIRVDDDNRFWWNLKTANPQNLPKLLPTAPDTPDTVGYKFWSDTLQGLLLEQNRENPKLNTLILISPEATYGDMVNILDEIDMIERSWNSYTAEQKGVDLNDFLKDPQYRDDRFSYRYAIGDWEDRDGKIVAAALADYMQEGGGQ